MPGVAVSGHFFIAWKGRREIAMGVILKSEAGRNIAYENFERIRKTSGMSNYAVSKAAKVSQSQLSRWKVHGLTPKTIPLLRICKVIDCDIQDIFQGMIENSDEDSG